MDKDEIISLFENRLKDANDKLSVAERDNRLVGSAAYHKGRTLELVYAIKLLEEVL